jgi:hypothetical protein
MSGPADTRARTRSAADRIAGRRRTGERLVALLIVGMALLNFPLLLVLRGRDPVLGLPALFVYLFVVWALLSVATALVLRERPSDAGDPGGSGSREP